MADSVTLRAAAERLAETPTKSTAHMERGERADGIEQMLKDLCRLAHDDGCIAAAWAYEYFTSAHADMWSEVERLKLRLYDDRELWCDQCDDDAKARAQAGADMYGVVVHVNVHGVRQWTARPSRIASLETEVERLREAVQRLTAPLPADIEAELQEAAVNAAKRISASGVYRNSGIIMDRIRPLLHRAAGLDRPTTKGVSMRDASGDASEQPCASGVRADDGEPLTEGT